MEGRPPSVKVAFFGLEPWKMIDDLSSLHGTTMKYLVFSRDQTTLLNQNKRGNNLYFIDKFYIPDCLTSAFIQSARASLDCDILFIPYALQDVSVSSCLSQLLARKEAVIDSISGKTLIITLGIPSEPRDHSLLDQLFFIQQQIARYSTINLLIRGTKGIFGYQKYETRLIDIISTIAGLVLSPQMINLSFGDLKYAMEGIKNQGVIGLGTGNTGLKAAQEAVDAIKMQQVDFTSLKKILIAVSCDVSTGLEEIGKTVSFVTQMLPATTRVFWGLSACPSKHVKVLLLCNPLTVPSREITAFPGSSRVISNTSALLPDFTRHRTFDDDLPEIDTLVNTGFLASGRVETASMRQDWNRNNYKMSENNFIDLKENEASMYVFNDGGLLLAHVPGSDIETNSMPESEPVILSGLLSAMQKMSGSLVGSELDSFKAGNKTCVFKKTKINGETVLNGVAIYNSTRNSEQKVISCLNGLLELVDSMYRNSVSEMCMKDRVDATLKEYGVLPAVNICAY